MKITFTLQTGDRSKNTFLGVMLYYVLTNVSQ